MSDFNVDDIYGSGNGANYLRANDLIINGQPKRVALTIENVTSETNFDKTGKQLVLSFVGKDKRFGLNKTNANMLCNLFNTRNALDWIGKTITLRPDKTQNKNGETVDCIRVDFELPPQVPFTPPAQAAQQQYAQTQSQPIAADDIPF